MTRKKRTRTIQTTMKKVNRRTKKTKTWRWTFLTIVWIPKHPGDLQIRVVYYN